MICSFEKCEESVKRVVLSRKIVLIKNGKKLKVSIKMMEDKEPFGYCKKHFKIVSGSYPLSYDADHSSAHAVTPSRFKELLEEGYIEETSMCETIGAAEEED